ncbi:Signal recognition particle receptor protein FtsY, alpha subunit [Streptococcus sp. DD10]|uniref:signal recognition particle-docking protein FtsY n=1 Tax=Streptococcus sp. DD10 TaxID=1777878 RepID=UPI000792A3DD|nr:signal recognition particle-docking protein FtsY [Streptococcus sp. DD10]KXT77119.1 Signal recognition particle receptor protein FtsY, alpha subunit [Streptococcus sp. DD10]
MGLFERLFGRQEEPQIEDIVKEALENIDLQEATLGSDIEQESLHMKSPEEKDGADEKSEKSSLLQLEKSLPDSEETVTSSKDRINSEKENDEISFQSTEVEQKEEQSDSNQEGGVKSSVIEAYYEELQARIAEDVHQTAEVEVQSEGKNDFEELQETEQDKYDRSLRKTRSGFGARLNAFFANFRSVDEEFFEELEELLILSDVGVQVASTLTEELRYEARLENAKDPQVLRRVIIEKLVELYEKDGDYQEKINLQSGLTVMLFVGVNGVGKTTSIGKLAYKYKNEGKKVLLVAADTFRAGAVAQLLEWGRRVDVPVVTGPEKSDPASVVFDGMEKAVTDGVDILMIDTAGRLQNKDNLMAELEKIGRIIKRVDPSAPHETFLALDASTGQNALVQAKEFSKITPVTGIVLTKIDGSARGGVVLAIREELHIPVKLIGFGEKIDDIGVFNSENFMRSLLDGIL